MIPPSSDPRWKSLVLGLKTYQFKLLALKILMGRLIASTKKDDSVANVAKCTQEVREFFLKNQTIAQHDINQIFG